MEKMRQGDWLHTSSFFYKSLMWGESKLSAAYFQFILIALNLPYNTNKLYKILDYRSGDMLNFNFGDMLNFNFSEKGLGQVSSPDFELDFSKKKCFSCYILLTEQISLSDCLYFSRYWTLCVLQLFVNQAVTSKIML